MACRQNYAIYFLYLSVGIHVCYDEKKLFFNSTTGNMMKYPFRVVKVQTFYQCVEECLYFKLCNSVHFLTPKCHLNQDTTETDPNAVVLSSGQPTYYTEKLLIPKGLAGSCADHNCTIDQRCIPTSKTEHICVGHVQASWTCYHFGTEDHAEIASGIAAGGLQIEVRRKVCEMVKYRRFYGTSPLKPLGCGTCYCCVLRFSGNFF